jgi:transposase
MKGRENSLKSNGKKTKGNTASQAVDTNAEYVKKLEKELLKLRIENAYLKELRRLRLEEEALQKKQRELYTVSEDSSD